MTARDHAGEVGAAPLVGHVGELVEQQRVVAVVGLGRTRPARRQHPRHAVEGVDAQAAVVGHDGQPGRGQAGARLEQRVALEGRLVLDRLVVRRDVVEAEHLDPPGDVASARIRRISTSFLALREARKTRAGRHERSAARCSRVSSAQPFSARVSRVSSSARSKGAPSAVPCTSTNAPVAGHHDVHVGLGADVVVVVQVEARHAVDDAHADRGDRTGQRLALQRPCRAQVGRRRRPARRTHR